MIHTVGDSHSANGWTGVVSHHMGPLLCYSFGKEPLNRIDIRHFNLSEGDTLIFCLGEIDCRCHIHKHINESKTYQEIIDSIVENYFDAIQINQITNPLNIRISIFNVVPPVEGHNTVENPEFPYLGTDEERKSYVLYFYNRLKDKCQERGYLFFDVYKCYVDEVGFLRKDLSDGNVHIRDGTYLTKFIQDHLSKII